MRERQHAHLINFGFLRRFFIEQNNRGRIPFSWHYNELGQRIPHNTATFLATTLFFTIGLSSDDKASNEGIEQLGAALIVGMGIFNAFLLSSFAAYVALNKLLRNRQNIVVRPESVMCILIATYCIAGGLISFYSASFVESAINFLGNDLVHAVGKVGLSMFFAWNLVAPGRYQAHRPRQFVRPNLMLYQQVRARHEREEKLRGKQEEGDAYEELHDFAGMNPALN